MGRRIKLGRGRAVVELSGPLLDQWATRLGQIAPVTMRVIDEEIGKLMDDAQRGWPVRSGRSKRSFESFTRLSRDGVEGVIENTARNPKDGRLYAYLIRGRDYGQPWKTKLVQPLEASAARVAEEAADELARLMEGRR